MKFISFQYLTDIFKKRNGFRMLFILKKKTLFNTIAIYLEYKKVNICSEYLLIFDISWAFLISYFHRNVNLCFNQLW